MWRPAALGLALMIGTGACATPTYTTSHGIRVYDQTGHHVPRQAVEHLTERALDLFGMRGVLHGVELHLHAKLIELHSPDEGTVIVADGYSDPFSRTIIVTSFTDCLAASSIVHELGHVVRQSRLESADPEHLDVAFWNSVEELEDELKREMCTPEQILHEKVARRAPGVSPADVAAPPSRKRGGTGGQRP